MVCTRASPALATLLAALLAAPLVAPALLPAPVRARRQLADDDALQPLQSRSGTTWAGHTAPARAGRTAPAPSPTDTAPWSRSRTPGWAPSWSAARRAARQATSRPTDDIPTFDRNKVSLDFPGNLFGPSVSLLIRTTKIVGDVVQNSAERYRTFLRLFRPLFKGPFEIKGLDPPTTTTEAPVSQDNELRRRRSHLPL